MAEFESTLIGRDQEVADLEEQLSSRGSGLVLLVGDPRMGKARLLLELRRRARGRHLTVVPTDDDPGLKPYLTVDRQSTIARFEDALRIPAATEDISSWDSGPRRVVLVYGYRPDAGFHSWFVQELLPELRTLDRPTTLVVAAVAGDVAELEPFAVRTIRVGPLPRYVVTRELESISGGIADPLSDNELQCYVDAVVADSTLLEAFRQLLPMSTAVGPGMTGDVGTDDL